MANILSWTQKIFKKCLKKALTIDFLYARMKNEKGKIMFRIVLINNNNNNNNALNLMGSFFVRY